MANTLFTDGAAKTNANTDGAAMRTHLDKSGLTAGAPVPTNGAFSKKRAMLLGTQQERVTILQSQWHNFKLAQGAGDVLNATYNGAPSLVVVVIGGHVCGECGLWNFDQDCHNPDCARYIPDTSAPLPLPQGLME